MKTDFLTAVRMVKEDGNLFADESVNGLEIYQSGGEALVFTAEFQGGCEVRDIPVTSATAEWTVYAPLGYKLDRTGEDRCYTLPGAKSIPKTLVSSEEEKAIQEDLARIERNKNLIPNMFMGRVDSEFTTGEKIMSTIGIKLARRVELGQDPNETYKTISKIWITPAEPEGIKPELIYTDKDGFI